MEKKEVAALLAMNRANYPYAYREMPKEEKAALLESWWLSLRQLPGELVKQAYLLALENCPRPVTVADVHTQVRRLREATEPTAEELWQAFLQAADRCHRLAAGFYYTGREENGLTQGQNRRRQAQAIFEELDPLVRDYCGSLSRLLGFGEMDRAHLEQIIWPSFRRCVEGGRDRRQVRARTSPQVYGLIQQLSQRLTLGAGEEDAAE